MPQSRLLVRTARIAALAAIVAIAGCSGAQTRKAEFMARGRAFLAQGDYQKARVEFRNALQIAPKDADVRYFNGLVVEKLGDAVPAAQFYQGALDERPDDVEARARLARLYFLYGNSKKALDLIQPSLVKHPNDPGLLTVRAAARSHLNDPRALADAEKAYKLAPRNEDTVAVLTGIYLKAGRKADAQAVLERGIADIPGTVSLRLALAEQFQAAHESSKAEALLKQLIAMQPKDPVYRIDLAHFYASQSNGLDDAEAVLRQGMQTLPDSSAMRTALVDFLSARRGPAAAETELHALITAHPDDANLHLQLASLYSANNQLSEAEAEYHQVISMDSAAPSAVEARDDLAGLRLRQRDTSGAESLIAQVLSKDPNDDDSLRMRAGLELARGDATSAIADLRVVLRDEPDSIADLRMLAAAQVASHDTDLAQQTLRQAMQAAPADPSPALDLIALLDQVGQRDQARQLAEALARQHPQDLLVLTAAFRVEFGARSLKEAAATAAAARSAAPKNPIGYYFSGLVSDASADSATAIRDYQQAIALAPSAREPLEALTRLYARQGKTALALQELASVAQSQPKDPLPPALSGEIEFALKRLPEAGQFFTTAIALDSSWMPAYSGLAHVEVAQKDVDGAIRTLESAHGKVRPLEAPDLELASLYEGLGRASDAVAAFQQALKDNPSSDDAANDLAMLLVATRSDQASLNQALSVAQRFDNSSNPYYVDTLGWVQYKQGNLTRALSTLGQAVNLAPSVPELRYHLAMAELKSGQSVVARDNLEKALSGGKPFDGMADARAVLTRMQSSGSPSTAARD
ncbi:MAG TPA: tetratricopeptide repeat protein [Steroidobacteraceae bacterium]|nr:tetratricopeptide repeat protein [Steroidobacteraceae bacterium]